MFVLALVDDVVLFTSVFVETLDKCFRSVCELDVVFNYSKVEYCTDLFVVFIYLSLKHKYLFLSGRSIGYTGGIHH